MIGVSPHSITSVVMDALVNKEFTCLKYLIFLFYFSACNCNPAGVVGIIDCDVDNGTCMCKANVDNEVNSVCDTCQDGFWNISTENPDGCQGTT